MISLTTAIATIHRDRLWWRKILIGGALWLTIVGYPITEGFQLESIENTEKGFPAPLPLWDMLGTKLVLGIFAAVIDFFFFIFPLLLVGLLLICGAFATTLAGTGGNLRPLGLVVFVLAAAYVAIAWLSSASPVAKRLYAIEGRLEQALSAHVLRTVWKQPARSMYGRARLHSLPLYIVPLALFAAAWMSLAWSVWLTLLLVWLGLSALIYVRLVVIQLYASAGKEIVRLNFEAWQQRAQL